MRILLFTTIIAVTTLPVSGQLLSQPIVLKMKGKVWTNNLERIRINGISFLDSDSVRLWLANSITQDEFTTQAISNISQIRETKHAFATGGAIGLISGALLGYGIGYLTYKEDTELTDDDNKDNAKLKGVLYAIGGGAAFGALGTLAGGIFIRKKFTINGNKQRLIDALTKIHN